MTTLLLMLAIVLGYLGIGRVIYRLSLKRTALRCERYLDWTRYDKRWAHTLYEENGWYYPIGRVHTLRKLPFGRPLMKHVAYCHCLWPFAFPKILVRFIARGEIKRAQKLLLQGQETEEIRKIRGELDKEFSADIGRT